MDKAQALKELAERLEAVYDSGAGDTETDAFLSLAHRICPERIDFRAVCENLYDGIHVTDGKGRILFINQAYIRTTGITPAEVLGRTVSDVEAEGQLYKGAVTAEVLQKRTRINSMAKILKIGKDVLVTGTPVFDEAGRIRMVVTNTRDFPELKRLEQQLITLQEESRKAREELDYLRRQQAGDKELFYHSPSMEGVMDTIRTVAPTDVTVLITGESGTGKELVANALYQHSDRRGKPFIKVNCAAIPAELLESELFGYEEGAFTGARRSGKAGLFELANTGVILLDEIGDMPLPLQTRLLRVLQQREVVRLSGSRPIKLDIRVIAATNKNLREEVARGRFREDLYYRLNVVPIQLKPLRDRMNDLPHLAERFCRQFDKKYGKRVEITPDGIDALMQYRWPGNIRELENMVERMVVTSHDGSITARSVFAALNPGSLSERGTESGGSSLKSRVTAYEREIVLHTLAREGSLRKAARVLGVDHSTLAKKLRQYDSRD